MDATNNISSYCNHVQELLDPNIPFNCKYVKNGNHINIMQISPIAKNEELNIQYSLDGSYWRNRKAGYPDEILRKARKFYKIDEPKKENKGKTNIEEIPEYQSLPKSMDHQADFNLMRKDTLFRWSSSCEKCNIRIATLNMNGALYEAKN